MGIANAINATQVGLQYQSSSGIWSGIGGVSSGYVLTDNGSGMPPSFQALPSGSITLNVDNSGSVSGSVLSLFASIGDGSANAGSTMAFIAATGSEIDLQTTDSGSNTLIGSNCGNASALGLGAGSNCGLGVNVLNAITTDSSHTAMGQYALSSIAASTGCTGVGSAALANATGGNFNSAFGSGALQGLLIGAYNTCLGISSGSNYAGAESSNICIVNAGVLSENNVIRIGTQGSGSGQQASCYIAGIYNNDSSGFTSPLAVYVDSSTGQLGYGSGSGGTYYSVTPYIVGQSGDANAQFTGTNAIANALAQIVTDNPSNATVYIKPGSYPDAFTVPTTANPISFIGLCAACGTLEDNSGVGANLFPTVNIGGAITGTGSFSMQNCTVSGAVTVATGCQFDGCYLSQSGFSFTVSANAGCQFSNSRISGSISSASSFFLLADFDHCMIDSQINSVSSGGDYFIFNDCYFTNNSSIVNTAAASPGMEAYNCRVDSSIWIDESGATYSFSTMKLNGIIFSNSVYDAFRLNPSVDWTSLSNISYFGSNCLIDDTAGSGSNNLQFDNCVIQGSGSVLNLANSDGIVIKNSVFYTASGISAGNNTTVQLINCDTFTSQPPASLGTDSTFTNFFISAPIDSHTTTTGGGVAGLTVGGGAVQNNANCDVIVNISVEVTSSAGGQLVLGVGPSNSPTEDAVTFPLTVSSSTPVTITAYVPYKYYIILDVTGIITTGSITKWVCAS